MIVYSIVILSSFIVAGLTFFSGFGLGSLLMPLFAVFFPVPVAIAATAVVHLLNNLFKVAIIGRHAEKRIVLRFGIPAVIAAFGGAWLLSYLSEMAPIAVYAIGTHVLEIYPVKLVIGLLMIVFAMFELLTILDRYALSERWIPVGGILSGFFGGLSGHQGALRTMFLIKAGLSKEAFVATVAVIGASVDIMRLFVYGIHRFSHISGDIVLLVICAIIGAWSGSFIGSRLLKKITMKSVRLIIGIMLLSLGAALASGVL